MKFLKFLFFDVIPFVILCMAPNPPTIKVMTYDTSRIVFTWDPPANDGGSPITGCPITMIKSGGSSSVVTTLTLTTTITSITTFNSNPLELATYFIKGNAVNAHGTSGDSNVVKITLQDPTSVVNSKIITPLPNSQFVRGDVITIRVDTYTASNSKKSVGGDSIYVEISDVCRTTSTDFRCARVGSGDPHYVPDILSTPIKIDLTDNGDGTYTGSFTMINAGWASIRVYRLIFGGLKTEIYSQTCWMPPDINVVHAASTVVPKIEFNNGGEFPGGLACLYGYFNSKLRPPVTCNYGFSVNHDDGVRVYINGVAMINKWICCGPTSFSINLVKNEIYDLYIEYYNHGGWGWLTIQWTCPGVFGYQILPTQYYWNPSKFTGTPYDIKIVAGPITNLCYVTGLITGNEYNAGFPHHVNVKTIWNVAADFRIMPDTYDMQFVGPNPATTVTKINPTHIGGEEYEFDFNIATPGVYRFDFKLGGAHIKDSPFTITIYPCHKYCNGCNWKTNSDCVACSSTEKAFPDSLNPNKCDPCNPGYYGDTVANLCKPCTKGHYQDLAKQDSCKLCNYHTYQDEQAKTACIPCGIGKYQNIKGQDYCKICHRLCYTCIGSAHYDCTTCVANPNLEPSDGHYCACKIGYFDDPAQTEIAGYCQPCAQFCTHCEGVKSYCTECVSQPGIQYLGHTCSCSLPGYFLYYNITVLEDQCVRCFPLCRTCNGPTSQNCQSCDLSKGAIYEDVETCRCKDGLYYDVDQETCLPCNKLCETCYGPSNNECNTCNVPFGALAVEDMHTTCVIDCDQVESHYKEGQVCKHCHLDCKACWQGAKDNCLICADSNKYMHSGECLPKCPTQHYSDSNKICQDCHLTCQECENGGKKACLSCISDLNLYIKQCLVKCPNTTYAETQLCKPCIYPCGNCLSIFECTSCQEPYYKNYTRNECVLECPPYTSPDSQIRECVKCHETCGLCVGTTKRDCKTCNLDKWLTKKDDSIGPCIPAECPSGTYKFQDYSIGRVTCRPCHKSCAECDKEGKQFCTACKFDSVPISSIDEIHYYCKSCSDINPGYYTSRGRCVEICGDGKNLGQFECDDGNNINGDGCDSNCKIEFGYACNKKGEDQPDICYDIHIPLGAIKVEKYARFEIRFSKYLRISGRNQTKEKLYEIMKISIEPLKDECKNFTWIITDRIIAHQYFRKLTIQLDLKCSLRENSEEITVNFTDPHLLLDSGNNELYSPIMRAKSKRFTYLTPGEKALIKGAGNSFSWGSLLTFGLLLTINLLQSAAMESFWAFLNMLQMISYIPLIDCYMPYNLEVFITDYLSISKMAIPFHLLPSFIPNPFSYLADYLIVPMNFRFTLCGFESLSFIYNFADQLVTWIMLAILYIILRLLTWCIPQDSCGYFHKWRKEYEFTTVIRVLIETYLQMVFCAAVNIWLLGLDTFSEKVSAAASALAAYLAAGFFLFTMHLADNPSKYLRTTEFKEAYGTLVEGLKLDAGVGPRYYNQFFMIRRVYYAMLLITLMNMPYLQIWAISIIALIPMLCYFIIIRPYEDILQNVLNAYNEIVLLSIFAGIITFNTSEFDEESVKMTGWALIGMILLSLVCTWTLTIPGMIKEFYKFLGGVIEENSSKISIDSKNEEFSEQTETYPASIKNRAKIPTSSQKLVIPRNQGKTKLRSEKFENPPNTKDTRDHKNSLEKTCSGHGQNLHSITTQSGNEMNEDRRITIEQIQVQQNNIKTSRQQQPQNLVFSEDEKQSQSCWENRSSNREEEFRNLESQIEQEIVSEQNDVHTEMALKKLHKKEVKKGWIRCLIAKKVVKK